MSIDFSELRPAAEPRRETFRVEASQVLESLRSRVADVLADLGSFTKPAEVQRALELDKTLSRQVFKLASSVEPMASGSLIPSHTSIRRFLDVAKGRGIDNDKIGGVLDAYKSFEQLIRTHAGDRVTFNSMVSAATGMDEDWIATDLQHRRNAFRTMSHTFGMQSKTQLMLFLIDSVDDGQAYKIALISGRIGLRVLRPTPRVRVHGAVVWPMGGSTIPRWEPLGLGDGPNEDLLEPFCSKPLPKLMVSDGNDEHGKWRQISMDHPEVGNAGSTTLFFGSLSRRLAAGSDPMLRVHSSNNKPTEVALFDVLINPKIANGGRPTGQAVLGQNEKFDAELIPLQGKFNPELLGRGPSALSTPEVPRYSEMLAAVSQKIGMDLSEFMAWRLRVEYPLYQSTMSMRWNLPTQPGTTPTHF